MCLNTCEESEVIQFAKTRCSNGTTSPPSPPMLKTRDLGPPPPLPGPSSLWTYGAGTCTHVAQQRDKTVLGCEVDSQKIEQVPRSSMWLAGKARLDWLMGSCHSHLGRHTCMRILQLWAVNSDAFICFLKENLDLDLHIQQIRLSTMKRGV